MVFGAERSIKDTTLYFLNVPAPVYDEKHSADLNSEDGKNRGAVQRCTKKVLSTAWL